MEIVDIRVYSDSVNVELFLVENDLIKRENRNAYFSLSNSKKINKKFKRFSCPE